MRPLTPARDIGLLIARALLGFVVAAHGYQKFFMNGMDATATAFEGMGVPEAWLGSAMLSQDPARWTPGTPFRCS